MRLRGLFLIMFLALAPPAARAEQISFVVNESALNKFASLGDKVGVTEELTIPAPPYPCPTFNNLERVCSDTLYKGEVSWSLSGVRFSLKQQEGVTLYGKLSGSFKGVDKLGLRVEFSADLLDVSASAALEHDAAHSRIKVTVHGVSASLTFKGLPGFGDWTPPAITLPTPDYGFSLPFEPIRLRAPTPSAGTIPVRIRLRGAEFELRNGSVVIKADFAIW